MLFINKIAPEKAFSIASFSLACVLSSPFLFWIYLHRKNPAPEIVYYALCLGLIVAFLFFFLRALIANRQEDLPRKGYDAAAVEKLFFYSLIALGSVLVFQLFLSTPVRIGLPVGHLRDFFETINYGKNNNYNALTTIGYLPPLLFISKVVSLFCSSDRVLFAQAVTQTVDLGLRDWALYAALMVAVLAVIIKPAFEKGRGAFGLPLLFVLFTSYPYLLELERGNWVMLSAVAYALVLRSFSSGHLPAAAAFASTIKIINPVFCPLFFLKKDFRVKAFAFWTLIFLAVPLAVLFLAGVEVNYLGTFRRVTSTNTFPDAHIAIAHSGVYALLVLFQDSGSLLFLDRKTVLLFDKYALIVMLLSYFAMEFFLRKGKHADFTKKDFCFAFIAVFSILKLLHPNNVDMNYIMLLPFIVALLAEKQDALEKAIFACAALFLFPFHHFNLFPVRYEELGVANDYYFTARILVFSAGLGVVVALLFVRLLLIHVRTPSVRISKECPCQNETAKG